MNFIADKNYSVEKIKYFWIIVLAILFVIAYFPVWKGLVLVWYGSADYSHGFFIVPFFLYLVWMKRKILKKIAVNPSGKGLFWILCSLLIYIASTYAELKTLVYLSMIFFLSGNVIYFYGFKILKELLFPFFMLLFMIPVPAQIYSSLTMPLQLLVSTVSTWLSSIINIPIYREGNLIFLPEHPLQVVQACSGLRSMISLLTLSAGFGYLTLRSNMLRAILFCSGIPISIAVNIIRVMVVVFAFYYFDYDLTHGTVHTIFGMAIFILALIFIVGTRGALSVWDRSLTQE